MLPMICLQSWMNNIRSDKFCSLSYRPNYASYSAICFPWWRCPSCDFCPTIKTGNSIWLWMMCFWNFSVHCCVSDLSAFLFVTIGSGICEVYNRKVYPNILITSSGYGILSTECLWWATFLSIQLVVGSVWGIRVSSPLLACEMLWSVDE